MKLFLVLSISIFVQNFSGHASANPTPMDSKSVTTEYVQPSVFMNDKSEYIALAFLSESCPCSKSHIAHVKELMKAYPELSFYGVVSEPAQNPEQKANKDEYFLKTNFGFPIIEDQEQKLVKKYKALKTPHVVLLALDKDKKYEVMYEGGITDSKDFSNKSIRYLKESLVQLSKGEKVKVKKGFCMGCYIRRY